jgi:hypothetical protein
MTNIGTDAVTERELKARLERFTGLENYSAWLIVAALLLEAVFVWRFSDGKSWLETSLFIMADLLLAAGVWGEIHRGRKAHVISAQLQSGEGIEAFAAADVGFNEGMRIIVGRKK